MAPCRARARSREPSRSRSMAAISPARCCTIDDLPVGVGRVPLDRLQTTRQQLSVPRTNDQAGLQTGRHGPADAIGIGESARRHHGLRVARRDGFGKRLQSGGLGIGFGGGIQSRGVRVLPPVIEHPRNVPDGRGPRPPRAGPDRNPGCRHIPVRNPPNSRNCAVRTTSRWPRYMPHRSRSGEKAGLKIGCTRRPWPSR